MTGGDAHDRLIAAITTAVRDFQDATDEVDEAAAVLLGINRTDLRCLAVLSRGGSMSAGELASQVGLSSGATTSAIDRLVRQGLAERVRRDRDRRRVTVTLTPQALQGITQVWEPLEQEAVHQLRRRDVTELEAIMVFLRDGTSLQAAHAERIRRMAAR